MFSIAVVQTKVISCNSANKSCILQVVHTKAIAALMQFCDFFDYLHGLTKTTTKTVIGLEPPKLIKLRNGVRIGQH